MKVDSYSSLIDKINLTLDDPIYDVYDYDDNEKVRQINRDQAKLFKDSNGNVEKSFLDQFANSGMSLYKATDDTLTHWSKLEIDENNQVKETPCN